MTFLTSGAWVGRRLGAVAAEALPLGRPRFVVGGASGALVSKTSTEPSCDALTRAYGVEQMSLASLHVYTDDPAFQVVGHDNFLMLLEEWFTLATQIGRRMAIAAKRQGGTSCS